MEEDLVSRANDLYWGSETSVNSLAEELDLSKGALYDMIEPYPAGIPCPNGDGEMGYANRTARDRGFVVCDHCGFEDEEIRLVGEPDQGGFPHGADTTRSRASAYGTSTGRLVGSALVGVALGVVIAGLVRRR